MKPAAPTLTLHFTEWSCGHHGTRPGDIEVQTPKQAIQICRAISHAISQPGSARAMVMDEESYFEVYISDDHVSMGHGSTADVLQLGLWSFRPMVIHGTAEDIEAIHSAELANALDLLHGPTNRLDPAVYVESGACLTSTLSEEDLVKLAEPIDWTEHGQRKKVFEAPPRLMRAADVLAELRAVKAEEDAYSAQLAAEAAAAAEGRP